MIQQSVVGGPYVQKCMNNILVGGKFSFPVIKVPQTNKIILIEKNS